MLWCIRCQRDERDHTEHRENFSLIPLLLLSYKNAISAKPGARVFSCFSPPPAHCGIGVCACRTAGTPRGGFYSAIFTIRTNIAKLSALIHHFGDVFHRIANQRNAGGLLFPKGNGFMLDAAGKLDLDKKTRALLWQQVIETIESYVSGVHETAVSPVADPERIRSLLRPMDFGRPIEPRDAIDFVVQGLWNNQVHTPHPGYFGLFNPAPSTMGIAADALVAAFNPQVATWNHSPFAVEVEQHLIRSFASRFGYESSQSQGTFTSGGAEANHTAVLTALVNTFPEFASGGLRGLERQPTLYVSTESHHSFLKAARICGLGDHAVRQIAVDEQLQMRVDDLAAKIAQDRGKGFAPFLVAATAGTTNAGVIDPLAPIGDVSRGENLWFHVDAAWGGAAMFIDELRPLFEGIERSDSITFDTHKWLSVPMGGGLYLTRHQDILRRTFQTKTGYMPPDAAQQSAVDPYTHSIQWSRRFIGLKVFLSLAVAGWDGYGAVIRHQVEMGHLLKSELEASGWEIVNRTKLPLVCFVDRQVPEGRSDPFLEAVQREVVSSGKAWISVARIDKGRPVLRACITNYRTEAEDIRTLVNALNRAREKLR